LLDDRRIRISGSDKWIRIRIQESQKHVDPDPGTLLLCFICIFLCSLSSRPLSLYYPHLHCISSVFVLFSIFFAVFSIFPRFFSILLYFFPSLFAILLCSLYFLFYLSLLSWCFLLCSFTLFSSDLLTFILPSFFISSVSDLGCLSRIPDPDFLPIPDPGSKNLNKREGRKKIS
jgi:hypothetical protein